MKIGITYRLFLAILTAAFLSVLCMTLIMGWRFEQGFLHYFHLMEQKRITRLAERLEASYAEHGNWDFLRHNPSLWRRLVATSLPEDEMGSTGREPPPLPQQIGPGGDAPLPRPLPPPPPHLGMPVFLLDATKRPLFGSDPVPDLSGLQPIHYRAQVVGYIGLLQRKNIADIRRLQFVRDQKFALLLIAISLLLLTMALSFPLARRLVRPIRALAAATRELAAGQYGARVPVASSDELGRLASDFNALALALEKNEKARRQWVADISHELRTPLAVLRGEVEALQDGIRELTPESIHSLHGEVMRLSRLVDDLYQLSLSDLGALSYRKEDVALAQLLREALALYGPEIARKRMALTADIPEGRGAELFGDSARLRQLFANLLDNSLKYTDEGGRLKVVMECRGAFIVVDIQDSPPGVPAVELERLFERLYRVEGSRNRAAGGAGLGLAICRNIVEAHGGTIAAKPSPLGGLWIRVTFPQLENSP